MIKNLTIFKTEPGWKPDTEKMQVSIPGLMGNSWRVLRNGSPAIDVNGQLLLTMETQEKLIPTSTVNKEVELRIAEFIKKTGDESIAKSKKFRNDIKEQVFNELSVKAFITSKYTNIWIDSVRGFMCIDTISEKKIDDVLTLAFKNGFELIFRLRTQYNAGQSMRKLLMSDNQQANGFSVGRACELISERETRSIKYKNESLDTEDVRNHLTQGKRVKKLELTYQDKIVFVLHDNPFLCISGIRIIEEIHDAEEYESLEAKIDADFAIMAGMYSELIGAVVETLGGALE